MKISCIQMDMRLGEVDCNFAHAQALIRSAAEAEHPDVVVLPETWNTGYFPADLASTADQGGILRFGQGAECQHCLRQRGQPEGGWLLQHGLCL